MAKKKTDETAADAGAAEKEMTAAEAAPEAEETVTDAGTPADAETATEAGTPGPEPTELEKAQALAEDYKRKWYSVSAEYDNYRKRNAAATSQAYADGRNEALLKLLPVADSFGYALDCCSDGKTREGIEKTIKSFNAVIESLGVTEIPLSEGDPFDETKAEAVMSVECDEGEAPGTVKRVIKKGYASGDKVIRFAQVVVTV